MADMIRSERAESFGAAEILLRRAVLLQRESCLFLIASVLDVFMTYMLLAGHGVAASLEYSFYESNPVADFFLSRWGLHGIIYFKFAMVALVEVIAHVVAFQKLHVARRLLLFGTLIVSCTVIYSLFLALAHR